MSTPRTSATLKPWASEEEEESSAGGAFPNTPEKKRLEVLTEDQRPTAIPKLRQRSGMVPDAEDAGAGKHASKDADPREVSPEELREREARRRRREATVPTFFWTSSAFVLLVLTASQVLVSLLAGWYSRGAVANALEADLTASTVAATAGELAGDTVGHLDGVLGSIRAVRTAVELDLLDIGAMTSALGAAVPVASNETDAWLRFLGDRAGRSLAPGFVAVTAVDSGAHVMLATTANRIVERPLAPGTAIVSTGNGTAFAAAFDFGDDVNGAFEAVGGDAFDFTDMFAYHTAVNTSNAYVWFDNVDEMRADLAHVAPDGQLAATASAPLRNADGQLVAVVTAGVWLHDVGLALKRAVSHRDWVRIDGKNRGVIFLVDVDDHTLLASSVLTNYRSDLERFMATQFSRNVGEDVFERKDNIGNAAQTMMDRFSGGLGAIDAPVSFKSSGSVFGAHPIRAHGVRWLIVASAIEDAVWENAIDVGAVSDVDEIAFRAWAATLDGRSTTESARNWRLVTFILVLLALFAIVTVAVAITCFRRPAQAVMDSLDGLSAAGREPGAVAEPLVPAAPESKFEHLLTRLASREWVMVRARVAATRDAVAALSLYAPIHTIARLTRGQAPDAPEISTAPGGRVPGVLVVEDVESDGEQGEQGDADVVGAAASMRLSERHPVALGVPHLETRDVSVLNVTLDNSKDLADQVGLAAYAKLLAEFLDAMAETVYEEAGTVDKVLGDSLTAMWNAPYDQSQHAALACRCMVRLQTRLERLKLRWEDMPWRNGFPTIAVRIAVHTGLSLVGNVGSTRHMDYTLLGEMPGHVSTLGRQGKRLGVRSIITQRVFEAVHGDFVCRWLDNVELRGAGTTPVYELLATKNAAGAEMRQLADLSLRALRFVNEENRTMAAKVLDEMLAVVPNDGAVKVLKAKVLDGTTLAQ